MTKPISLSDVINEQLKNHEFAEHYERELLINAIAEVVVKLRQTKQLTQQQLAEKVGTTQSAISRLESGNDTRVPSLDILARIANATKTKVNIVFEEKKQ